MPHPIRAALAAVLLVTAGCGGDPHEEAALERRVAARAATAVAPGDVSTAQHAHGAVASAASDTVTVYKSPTCGCCKAWVDHMEEAGFTVVSIDMNDVNPVKHEHGVSQDLGSCHTALVGGYVVEGHVPAADVKRLLAERPQIAGLAVPGMPMGSPGMEGLFKQKYDVIAFSRDGGRSVFASH